MKSTEFVKQRFDVLEALVDSKFNDDYIHKLCETIVSDTLTYEPYFEGFKIFFINTFDNIIKLGIACGLKFEDVINIYSHCEDCREDIQRVLQKADELDDARGKIAELVVSQEFPKWFISDSSRVSELLMDLVSSLSKNRRIRDVMRKIIEHADNDDEIKQKQEEIAEKLTEVYEADKEMIALTIIGLLNLTISFNIPIYQFYDIKE